MSIKPGKIVRPRASISCEAPGSSGPTAEISPSSTAISALTALSRVTMVPPRTTRSAKMRLPLLQEVHAGIERRGHIFQQNIFVRMMAEAAGRPQKQHGGRNLLRQNHRVMP